MCLGRLSSRCSSGHWTARTSADVDWYGCDTLEHSQQHPSLTRPHSVTADGQMSPLWCEHGTSTRLHVNSPAVSRQSSAREKHEQQRRHYIENGVEQPRYDNNDLLQRHRSWFRKERPFTPRTLQSTQTSRLSSMSGCYRSPRRSRARADSQDLDEAEPDQTGSCPGAGKTLSDSITFETLGGRPSQRRETPAEVPPLGISLDADQMKYMKQQSQREELETVSETHRNKTPASQVLPDTRHVNRATLAATTRQL